MKPSIKSRNQMLKNGRILRTQIEQIQKNSFSPKYVNSNDEMFKLDFKSNKHLPQRKTISRNKINFKPKDIDQRTISLLSRQKSAYGPVRNSAANNLWNVS